MIDDWRHALMFVVGMFFIFTAHATDEGEALTKTKRCYACHADSETLIGPPYKAIALFHAANKEVMVDVLARKIIFGGAGNWGIVPMVPNDHVTLEEARVIAEWILNQ